MNEPLRVWAIYDHPADFPEHWVARCWNAWPGRVTPGEYKLAKSLKEVRQLLPPGLVRLHRMPSDDEKVVETWI